MSVLRPNGPSATPCIGRCSHNVGDLVCKGCGRTIEEVRDWNLYDPQKKAAVKAAAQKRINP